MNELHSTPEVARVLGVKPARIRRAIFDGRLRAPELRIGRNYVWRPSDIEAAAWLFGRRLDSVQTAGT